MCYVVSENGQLMTADVVDSALPDDATAAAAAAAAAPPDVATDSPAANDVTDVHVDLPSILISAENILDVKRT